MKFGEKREKKELSRKQFLLVFNLATPKNYFYIHFITTKFKYHQKLKQLLNI